MAKIPPPTRKGEPPSPGNTMRNLDKAEPEGLVALNFKVPPAIRKEYKIFAATNDMAMVEVLQESFALFKRERMK